MTSYLTLGIYLRLARWAVKAEMVLWQLSHTIQYAGKRGIVDLQLVLS